MRKNERQSKQGGGGGEGGLSQTESLNGRKKKVITTQNPFGISNNSV